MDRPAEATRKPSPADYLAAERTLLAWIRTGLALMGFGFVLARFALFLEEMHLLKSVPPVESYGFSLWSGIVLIVTGVMVNAYAGWHHVRLVRALGRGEEPYTQPSIQAIAIAFFLALVGLAMAVYLISVRGANPSQPEKVRRYQS